MGWLESGYTEGGVVPPFSERGCAYCALSVVNNDDIHCMTYR